MIIIKPDNIEVEVIGIKNIILLEKLNTFFNILSSFKYSNAPELICLYSIINYPFNVLKSKNNSIVSSNVIKFNDIIFECKMQTPINICKSKVKQNGRENFIEISIMKDDNKFSIYSLNQNRCFDNSNFLYYIESNNISDMQLYINEIDNFINQYNLVNSYISIYKQINYDDFLEIPGLIKKSEHKDVILNDSKFLLHFVVASKNPITTLENLLFHGLILPIWESGMHFFQHLLSMFPNQKHLDFLKEIYDKFILYFKMQSNLNSNGFDKVVKL